MSQMNESNIDLVKVLEVFLNEFLKVFEKALKLENIVKKTSVVEFQIVGLLIDVQKNRCFLYNRGKFVGILLLRRRKTAINGVFYGCFRGNAWKFRITVI